jgi:hypothetical protein
MPSGIPINSEEALVATAGGPNPPPVHIIEEHDLTEIHIHCDVGLSETQLANINSSLQDGGLSPIRSRRRELKWAITGEGGGFWEFRIQMYTLSGRDEDSLLLHILIAGDKVVRTEPTAYRRSRRTVERIKTLVDALFQEELKAELDCNMTWHSSPDSWLLPIVLPLDPPFPEESVIQEISGVIGCSTDGNVKFVVDRVATDPMMFHIWLGFKHELPLSPNVMVEAIAQGIAMLEAINLWDK